MSRILNWLKKFEKYLFYYKDGYYVLPYLTNTPKLMVESLSSMPFINHVKNENVMYSKSPFMKGQMRYKEVENGLWLIVSEIEFLVNVHTKSYFDDIDSDFYFLAFSVYKTNDESKHGLKINNIQIASNSWTLYRPGITIDAFHQKGNKGIFYNFSFNKEWMESNLLGKNNPSEILVHKILGAELGYVNWEGLLPDSEFNTANIWKMLSQESEEVFNQLQLKILTLEVISMFFSKVYQKIDSESNQIKLKSDRSSLNKVENFLVGNLENSFPGIEFLSKMVNMSPSSLKSKFKIAYGTTIFQYFKNKQMQLAIELLKNPEVQIKNVASLLGYENPSKFSATFKKANGKLPSEFIKLR